ncbi:MAG TPA: NAD(P)H-dependent oxidoreductase [Puia sp.]
MTVTPLVILASARKHGDTRAFLDKVFDKLEHKQIDLLDFHISSFDYSNNYPDTDDFLRIVDEILQHNVIVFATPVYWYSMSGLMKTFFDRLTDLLTVKKKATRQLKGKSIFLLTVGVDQELPKGFEIPFKLTSAYLNMTYRDCIYYSTKFPKTEEEIGEAIDSFTAKMKQHYR